MHVSLKKVLALSAVVIATQAVAEVTLYEREGFDGRSFTTQRQVGNMERFGFNDRASSATVAGERWEVCEDPRFSGRCVVLRPGRYPSLAAMGLNDRISSVRAVRSNERIDDGRYAPVLAAPQVTFYEQERFGGQSFTTQEQVDNLTRFGFNDRASSADVVGAPWEVCDDAQFRGGCVVLRPGRYPSLAAMGLNDRISSVRGVSPNARVNDDRYAPAGVYDARRRNNERLFEANVTSVRAVVGPPEQRCWVEREQVAQEQRNASINVPAAIAGAVIGGILGHQVGGGSGKDLATVGGVIAGGALGANVGSIGGQPQAATQDVQRCTSVPSQAKPELWDVTYNCRGQEHRVQMTMDPGPTVIVNDRGEPRARP
jgi:uncharacterized protein YcfJ